jgi:hypothetical protein
MPVLGARRERLQPAQNHDRTAMVLIRPIAFGCHVVVAGKECGVLLPEHLLDLISCPDIELTLDAFTIRIEAGAKAAARRAHFAPQPLDGLAHGLIEDRLPGLEPGKG